MIDGCMIRMVITDDVFHDEDVTDDGSCFVLKRHAVGF